MLPQLDVLLRHDLHRVLAMIRVHALLHWCKREKDGKGRIVTVSNEPLNFPLMNRERYVAPAIAPVRAVPTHPLSN